MTDPAKAERAAVVAFLEKQSRESMWLSDSLPWWRFRLKFANHVAAAACRNLLGKIEAGEHLAKEREA